MKPCLLKMIDNAMRLLDHCERLEPMPHALGKRHTGYGVQAAHYDTMGAACV